MLNKEIKISRHGTFISKVNIDHNNIFKELDLLLKEHIEINWTHLSAEEKRILQDISSSIKDKNVSQSLNLANKNVKIKFNFSDQELQWLSKHRKKDWINYIIYRYKFKVYPAIHKETDFPLYLLIEPTSVCNIRCVMCFQVDESFSKKKEYLGFMDIELFKKIINDAKENNCQAITLASRGEPTLHKQFNEMMKILKKSNILDLKINTNATVLTEEKSRQILDANFSEVVFSVDAGTKETYESIRVLGKFERVVQNIKMFKKIRETEFPNSSTITRISGVKVNDSQDLIQMSEFWSRYVDEVSIKNASPRWDSYNNKVNNEINPCLNLWYRMYIWHDGTSNPCDFDYKSFLSQGSIKTDSISDIWTNDSYKKFRENHLNKNRKKHTPCDRCPITH